MDTIRELFGNVGMACPTGLGDIRSKDGRPWVDERPQIMTPVTARTRHLSRLLMNACLEKLSGSGTCTHCVLLDEFYIRMAPVTCLLDIGNMGHRFGVLAGEDIVFPVAVVTISRSFRPLHDRL